MTPHAPVHGYGPHDIISLGEILATLIVMALGLTWMGWMAFQTRHHMDE